MKQNNLRTLKKKPTLDFSQMSPFHANMLKKSKNPNFIGKSKQTYSSFLIKMLDETPLNFNKSIKKISNTAYKHLFKKNTSFNPFNTNYSPAKKNTLSSFEKVLNKIEHQIIKKNEYLKEYRNKGITEGEKLNRKTSNQNITEGNTKKFNFKNLSSNNFNSNPNKDKNVKMKLSYNNIKQKRLNALYGYDSNFIKSRNHLLKKKDSFGLGKYQNEVLKVSQRNLSKDYMMKLFTELQFIRKDADLVKPLPPINYRALVTHCFKNQDEKKEQHSFEKGYKKMDEYEKELYIIKKKFTYKKEKTKRNKRMYKIYEILPEYVIDALYKKRNRQINF